MLVSSYFTNVSNNLQYSTNPEALNDYFTSSLVMPYYFLQQNFGLNNLSQLNTDTVQSFVKNLHNNATLINQMVELYNSIQPYEKTIPKNDLLI